MGSKKQKDKAERQRLEFLANLAQQLDQRTDRMALRLAELAESQDDLAGQVAGIGERLARLAESQAGVAEVLSETLTKAGEARKLAENPPSLLELGEQLAAMETEGERVAGLLQGISSGFEGLHQALEEERGRGHALAGRLEALDQIQRGLLEREQGLQEALEALGKDRVRRAGEASEADAQALGARLDDFDGRLQTAIARWGEEVDHWEEAQQTQATGLEVLQGRLDRLEPLVQEGGRLLQRLADDLQPLARGLDAQEASGQEVQRRLDTLEGGNSDLDRRLGQEVGALRHGLSLAEIGNLRHSERLEVLETLIQGLQARIDHLADEHQADVDGLGSRLADLEKRTGVRDQGLLRLAQAIANQGQRIGELQMETEGHKSRYQELERELDHSGALLEETRERVEHQGGWLKRLSAGQRILGVTAAAAVLALLVATLGSHWFESQRRELEHRSVVTDLDRMERRLAAVSAGGSAAPQVQALAQRLDRLDDKVTGVDPRVAELEARQRRAEATLERLRATLVKLEERRKARLPRIPAVADAGEIPKIVRAQPGGSREQAAMERPKDSVWRLAQQRREFSIQIMAMRNLDRLRALVEREGLLSRVAWCPSRVGGKPGYLVFFGHYPDEAAARAALKALPEVLRGGRPWVRRLPGRPPLYTWSGD